MAKATIAATFSGALMLAFALAAGQRSETTPAEVIVERGIAVSMRDRVVLRADIFRPKRQGRFPVLLERTPYDKSQEAPFGYRAAPDGYVVVLQDVRGRYTSEGEWYPFKHESDDGYDTIEWAARLPYSNGTVGMFGGSYVGATQMLAPSFTHHIWPAFARLSPPAITTTAGHTREAHSSSGLTNRGPLFLRRTPSRAWSAGRPTPSRVSACCRSLVTIRSISVRGRYEQIQ